MLNVQQRHRGNLTLGLAVATVMVAVLGVTPVGEAAKRLILPRNSVSTEQIRNRSILPVDLSRRTIDYLNAAAPPVRAAAGVTVSYGAFEGKLRISGARLVDNSVVGQLEYLGGLGPCPNSGPSPFLGATFFDADGLIVDTGSDYLSQVAPGARYPFKLSSRPGAVRAELVVTGVACI